MMRLHQLSPNPRWRRHRRWQVCLTMACALGLILALTADVWARSSGGRYGGRAGFSQARRGFESSGSRPSTIPSRPYSGRSSLGYPVPSPSPSYPVPIPIPMPGPGYGPSGYVPMPFGGGVTSAGGIGFGGILGVLIVLGIVAFVGKVLLQN